jgi:hypothetical protein
MLQNKICNKSTDNREEQEKKDSIYVHFSSI